jgi:cyclophilin family peptidyl-prolyl cis-trans isomerase
LDPTPILEALEKPDVKTQRLAVRALGRLERPENAEAVAALLESKDPGARMEAVNALGQMEAPIDLKPFLEKEKVGSVRSVIYETMGRLSQFDEDRVAAGLQDRDPQARVGAAKGLETWFRRTDSKPKPETVVALRKAIRDENPVRLRKLALLTLNRADDRDVETLSAALEDSDPQVRRLAVMGLGQWKEDPSFMVRYESLEFAQTCDRVEAALDDTSEHVALAAIDRLGELGCAANTLEKLVTSANGWRRPSRAIVSLAKVSPEPARRHLDRFIEHEVWQARAYGAEAAKILTDKEALDRLVNDPHPNVVAAALVDPRDAVRALGSPDYGLLMVATRRLEGWSEGASAMPSLLAALERVTAEQRATSRDPRRQILTRLSEFGDASIASKLRPLLEDFDPVIAKLAADIISERSGSRVEPKTLRFETSPVPRQSFIQGLAGAQAKIKMKEAGTFLLELIPEEAPVTVATFVKLAEKGHYNGLTFHRIVPNFVIQGGSPGANEYVGTPGYIRDECGLLSHLRGTVGISTRGRDTGDSQIFINLVDNYRLDHNYTIFARVIEGMENVDEILEGDVMESVEILRKNR